MSSQQGGTRNWTPEQSDVLASFGQGLAVTAGAGAGKTTTLVEKCVRLLLAKPESRICAVSFTERSASDLRDKLSRALRDSPGFDLSRHWITTIHGLCGTILREFPAESGFQGDERVLSELEAGRLWKRALESLWNEEDRGSALQRILEREAKAGTESLLARFRELEATGVVERALAGGQPDLKAVAEVAARVLDRYDRLKKKSSGIDFGDLEKAALRALEHEHVRRLLQARFELVLVDEFQDTNPVQARILWSIIRQDQSNLCVVGDPKQSIYRFRDADVRLFEESCSSLAVQRSLTWNFRSHPAILEAVNRICDPLFDASGLAYEGLTPGRKAEEFGLEPDEPAVARLDVESPEGLARWIAAERSRGVSLESMAILMRRIRGMEAWIQALSRSGIPVAVGGGGLFWQDPRVSELLSLLTWWAFPVDEWAALGFLTAPWVGVPASELDDWKRAQGAFEPFWDSSHPIASALRPLRPRQVRPGELLLALLENSELESRLSELSQSLLALWHRCEQLSLQGCDFQEVVRRLNDAVENGRREKEVPPPANRGVLPILTVHASKGLEFDRVFLVDFGKKSRASALPLLFSDRNRGVYLTPRTPDGKKDDRDEIYRDWKNFEQAAVVAESKRQLYVALTRARKQLVFVCQQIDPEKGFERDREKALLADHWRGWLEHLGAGIPALEFRDRAAVAPASEAGPQPSLKPRIRRESPSFIRSRHSVSEWTVLARCPRAYADLLSRQMAMPEGQDSPARIEKDFAPEFESQDSGAGPLFRAQLPDARTLGKAVHAALEDWLRGGGRIAPEIRSRLLDLDQEALLRWIEAAAPPSANSFAELPFEWLVEGVPLVGVLDRVDEVAPGQWRIMDYKVSTRRKSDDDLRALYAAQLEIYAGALIRLLGAVNLSAVLVQITPEGVFETEVHLDLVSIPSRVAALAASAGSIASIVGAGGLPDQVEARIGISCRNCLHRTECSALQRR
jgi:ATP-dependent exoDNAse (exonuclease V) beta subunit